MSRYLKKYSREIYANDLENYSRVLNSCYLTNEDSFNRKLYSEIKEEIESRVSAKKIEGLFSKEYAPKNTETVEKGERCFYTRENALLLDSYRFFLWRNFSCIFCPLFLFSFRNKYYGNSIKSIKIEPNLIFQKTAKCNKNDEYYKERYSSNFLHLFVVH